jgi:hypothetical protein
MDPRLIELFLLGAENALLDAGQLGSLGIEDGATLFMLQRQSAFLQLRSCVSACNMPHVLPCRPAVCVLTSARTRPYVSLLHSRQRTLVTPS